MRIIFHIDFNSYFASVEQQANPRLRGKPVGVTGGDRMTRTVLGAASMEAKRFGVKTGMQIWEAKKLCPDIIIVPGDSDKYLEVTKRFLGILSSYSPNLEVFSIDEVFMVINSKHEILNTKQIQNYNDQMFKTLEFGTLDIVSNFDIRISDLFVNAIKIATKIKQRIRAEVGDYITCSIGISYNKLMAKLAGSLQKPDGLVVIPNQQAAIKVLDKVELDEICGIGPRIKSRLNNMGIFSFAQLRKVPLEALLASFKSYGQILYNMARGVDHSPIVPFYEKEEVKSIGHRHTIDHDTNDSVEIKQILLKLTELIARRLRAKKLVGKTISLWYRSAFHQGASLVKVAPEQFEGGGMQTTIPYTNDGLEIFKAAWEIFQKIWPARNASQSDAGGDGDRIDVDYFLPRSKIRMIGVSISNLKPQNPQNLSLLPEISRQEKVVQAMDSINDRYGEFTLQRGILLNSTPVERKPNPFLSDRRFKL